MLFNANVMNNPRNVIQLKCQGIIVNPDLASTSNSSKTRFNKQ